MKKNGMYHWTPTIVGRIAEEEAFKKGGKRRKGTYVNNPNR